MTVRVNKSSFNIREKLSELERPIGLKGSELMRAETAQDARDLIGAGRKNLLINGNFRISQRGDYTSATVVGGTSYTLDRWKTLYGGGGTVQHKKNQLLPNGDISDSVRTITTATGYVGFEQFIEFPEYYSGQTFTISFWIKTNYSSTEINVYNGSTFVLPSSRGRLNETSGEWKYFSKTFTMPSSGNSQFRIEFWTGNGSTPTGSYIEIAQVQVERGTLATEFEHRSYAEELALCQRYFQLLTTGTEELVGTGYVVTTSTANTNTYLRTEMRDTPTLYSSNSGSAKYRINTASADANTNNEPTINTSISSRCSIALNWTGFSGLTGGQGCQVRQYLATGVLAVQSEL